MFPWMTWHVRFAAPAGPIPGFSYMNQEDNLYNFPGAIPKCVKRHSFFKMFFIRIKCSGSNTFRMINIFQPKNMATKLPPKKVTYTDELKSLEAGPENQSQGRPWKVSAKPAKENQWFGSNFWRCCWVWWFSKSICNMMDEIDESRMLFLLSRIIELNVFWDHGTQKSQDFKEHVAFRLPFLDRISRQCGANGFAVCQLVIY